MVALHRDDGPRVTSHPHRVAPVAPAALPATLPASATRPHLRLVHGDAPPLRRDSLPEHWDYSDTGCQFSPSCLKCPLPRCKYDDPDKARRMGVLQRDREIVLLRTKHRAPIDLLAHAYGVSSRTVFRALEEARAARGGTANNEQQTAKDEGQRAKCKQQRTKGKEQRAKQETGEPTRGATT